MTENPENLAAQIEIQAPKEPLMADTRALAKNMWQGYKSHVDPFLKVVSDGLNKLDSRIDSALPAKSIRHSGTYLLTKNLLSWTILPLSVFFGVRSYNKITQLDRDLNLTHSVVSFQATENDYLRKMISGNYKIIEYTVSDISGAQKGKIYAPKELLEGKDLDKSYTVYVMEPLYYSAANVNARDLLSPESKANDHSKNAILQHVVPHITVKPEPLKASDEVIEYKPAGSPAPVKSEIKEPLVATPIEDKPNTQVQAGGNAEPPPIRKAIAVEQ